MMCSSEHAGSLYLKCAADNLVNLVSLDVDYMSRLAEIKEYQPVNGELTLSAA
jgi:hypothetical protein